MPRRWRRADPAIVLPTLNKVPRCQRCGYLRRGLASESRCPECGAPPPSELDRHEPLDRFDRLTIVGAIRAQALVLVAHLAAVMLFIALLAGPGRAGWIAAAGAVAGGLSVWLRCRAALSPPSWPRSRIASILNTLGPTVALVSMAGAMIAVAATGTESPVIAWASALPVIAVAALSAREGAMLAEWTRDDWAGGAADLALSAAALGSIAVVVLWPLGLLLSSTTFMTQVVSGPGLDRLAGIVIRLSVVCWWLLQAIADARLLVSAALCLWHRAENDRIEDRRAEREAAWNEEVSNRFDDRA